ncbi:molybdopterin-binding oxidoreductase [Flaviaesturariibacter flavus]|uniref:Molybdopterin-binding oxidoreductase n=1 Tax=Flaviaesturariibacter flavus TaxID=2502780 RepID=A0A4R1B3T9_9BACT|nr:molybdopterin-dependent oxidoreductase [Flaviaesturariibacter flavus]TCJ12551.1 molybdopterin-binding oxidoreductase [Flaviaesturariibacter flavus]
MKNPEPRLLTHAQWRRRTLLSFAAFLLMLGGIWLLFRWIGRQPDRDGTPAPLRSALQTNEKIFSKFYDSGKLARSYPLSAALRNPRVNGRLGTRGPVDPANWHLSVVRAPGDTLRLTLDDIKALPKKEIVFDFKCIEGWSQVTHWGGVSLKTFLEHYGLKQKEKLRYVGLETPDGGYYVGIDMPSALHPQTLLCYEMNGAPLSSDHGAPLRLIIPVKYGIKHLKRIGTLFFSNTPPRDYWAERGYDYYSGH